MSGVGNTANRDHGGIPNPLCVDRLEAHLCIIGRYTTTVILSTKGKLAASAVRDRYGKGFPTDLIKRTRAMLSALNAAIVLEDLRFPPGNHLEELEGDRVGQHSIRINDQWRICFAWTDRGPESVEIVDYH